MLTKNAPVFDKAFALTPLDGRNRHKLTSLTAHFSDFILNKYRLKIEVEYLTKLGEYKIINLPLSLVKRLSRLVDSCNLKDYNAIREIEYNRKVNHEVKAVEEFLKSKIKESKIKEMVHFGLTSDDINNLAYGLMIKNTIKQVILPEIGKILEMLKDRAKKYKKIPMLSRTHGQPATPTTLGKEFLVYYQRLNEEVKILKNLEIKGKLTGNTGNLNAHRFIFPQINWLNFSKEFVLSMGLKPDLITTQIEPYDSLIRIFQSLSRINNILLGLSVDFWLYITLGYFKQKLIKVEVGSTALPHKINPIYFEGAEGGFGIANALLEFYCRKLSYSRLQRDLSDSTVRRSFGIAFGYSLLSYQSIVEALIRIEADSEAINEDLSNHFEILSEPIQNFLRTKNYKDAYDKTKEFFRGKKVNRESIKKFIENLDLDRIDKDRLIQLLPEKYLGYAKEIVDIFT